MNNGSLTKTECDSAGVGLELFLPLGRPRFRFEERFVERFRFEERFRFCF